MIFTPETKRRKLYTLLLLGPHGRPFKIQVPKYALYALLAFTLAGVVMLTALAKSYARMLMKVSNYNYLRADRENLQTKYRLLEGVVKHTNTQLTSLESLASEVAVSYGFSRTAHAKRTPATPAGSSLASNISADSSYDASLYAFNLFAQSPAGTFRNSALFGLLSNPSVNPADIPCIWPVQGEVTSGFGERTDPFSGEGGDFHAGMDIAVPSGTPVRAAADGIVLHAGPDAGYGNEILIDHGAGIGTKYGHLRRIYVVEGQEVKQGQIIGTVGMSGHTTGPHLHYEVLVRETPVNPAKFLRG